MEATRLAGERARSCARGAKRPARSDLIDSNIVLDSQSATLTPRCGALRMEGFISVRFDFVVAGAFLPGHPDTVLFVPAPDVPFAGMRV
jgi:hypothetical protein